MWESLRTVRVYLWRYRGGLALGLGALVLKDVAGAVQPLVIRAAIDSLSHAFGPDPIAALRRACWSRWPPSRACSNTGCA